MTQTEIEIRDYLASKGIYPFSVLFMKDIRLLKVSFYLPTDIQEFLEISGYKELCDNYGYQEYPDTVLVFGGLLTNFLRNVGCRDIY